MTDGEASSGSTAVAPVERLSGGVHMIRVPIPDNPLGHTLVYVLESDRGPVLVDAGWHAPAAETALRDGAGALGFALSDVRGVLVTHQHPDHHGLSGVVREESGGWIAMHPADRRLVERFREFRTDDGDWQSRSDEMFLAVGATAHELGELPQDDAATRIELPALPDRDLVDGELADVPGRRVRTVWTPGHSPGHTCFVLEEDGRLLAGDHLLPDITPHVGLYEPYGQDGDPLGDFLDSLERLTELAVDHVLPAHRHPFDGVAGRVREIRAHHEQRLQEVLALLADGPATPWELAQRLSWNVAWDQVPVAMRRAALGETTAHLRHLELRGAVEPLGTGPPLTYRAAS